MQTLINENFIGDNIDQEIQAKNLIEFIKYIEYNLNTQENTQSIYYKDLFNQCISEIETLEKNSIIDKAAYPYILALYYLVKQKYNQQNCIDDEYYVKRLSALNKVQCIIVRQRNQQEITEEDKFNKLFQQISGFYPKNVLTILQFVHQDLIVNPYTQNHLTTYTQLQIKELSQEEAKKYYQNIASEVKKANDSTTQNLLNDTQEINVLDFLKKKYPYFDSKDNDERRQAFFAFVNDVIINDKHLPPFTNEGDSYDNNNIDALSPYLTFINQYNEKNGVSIKGGFMEPDNFTSFNETKQRTINIFINDFINGKEYLKINQEALEKLKEVFNNNNDLKKLTLELYYQNAFNYNISQVNGFFNHAKKNQYIDQTIKIISDYLEIKNVPQNDQYTIITELKKLKNANSFKKFFDALIQYCQSLPVLQPIIGKDRVTGWKDVVTNNNAATNLSQ